MHDPLAPLLHDGVVDEIVSRLKSGKEADLWLVRHGGEVVAAKVYKARETRSFKNNAGYREGRQVRDTRTQRAMAKGSRFGQAAAEEAWKAKEADALHQLHAAGVRVPRPVMFYEGVLLMELVLDAHGHPAPRLIDAQVAREDAAALYADLRGQAVRMLACDVIHGDLSPYNILLGHDGPVVIDFPQVVGAAHNSQAEGYFRRDLENVRQFFAGIDPALGAAEGDAREIWRAYVRRELTPDFVPTGRAEPAPRHERPQGPRRPQEQQGPRRPQPAQGSRHPQAPQGPRQPQPQQGQRKPQVAQGPRQPPAPQGQRHSPPAEVARHPQPAQPPRHPQAPQGPRHPQAPQGQRHPTAPQGQRHPQAHPAERKPQDPARGSTGSPRADPGGRHPRPQGSGAHPPARPQPVERRAARSSTGSPRPDLARHRRPAPEVVRVTRPPLGPPRSDAPPTSAHPPRGTGHPPPHAAPGPGAAARRRRRRRGGGGGGGGGAGGPPAAR
jgi:RIO kinase 1